MENNRYIINGEHKKTGVPNKIDFKIRNMRKKGCLIIIKGSIYQEDITITNTCKTSQQCLKIHDVRIDRIERRNRPFNSNSWRFQCATFNK